MPRALPGAAVWLAAAHASRRAVAANRKLSRCVDGRATISRVGVWADVVSDRAAWVGRGTGDAVYSIKSSADYTGGDL